MNFGMYLLFTAVVLLFFSLWIRSLVVRRLAPERLLGDLRREVQELVGELNQTGDRHITLMEDRINTLHELLRDADHQIDDLRLVLEAHHAIGDGRTSNNREEPLGVGESPEEAPVPQDSDPSREDLSRETHEEPAVESTVEYVRRLGDQGLSSDVIAQKTGVAIGEVELILSLRRGQLWR